jgi:hypothetical protein
MSPKSLAHLAESTGHAFAHYQEANLRLPCLCTYSIAGSAREIANPQPPGSRKLPSGDGWRFAWRVRNVDAAYAAAGAVRLARIAPTPQSLKLVTEST